MPFSFLPRMIFPHLTDVTAEALRARGISFLMLDFDNTIVPYTTSEPTAQMAARGSGPMQASEIRLCIVSNSRKPARGGVLQNIRARLHHAREKALFSAASAPV